ncbi:MAG TPA: 3-dehydroquinate synthase [Actinomycetota bacterium]|nr:3-dehydroquinate synthase [Actinomycetota bacterium]
MTLRRLHVTTTSAAYDVVVGPGVLERAHEYIRASARTEKIVFITDASVYALHGERAAIGLAPLGLDVLEFVVEPGERSKTPEQAATLWRALAQSGVHRGDVVVALGGGVVGDLAGFVAATYHRGMAFYQMPTTLLAQVDAAIGGKTAVDLPEGKNLVGAFHQPRAVLADTSALSTLSDREFSTGMAEVVKHALIDGGSLHEWVGDNRAAIVTRDPQTLTDLVAEAAAVKVRIVGEDETEQGVRAHLNYGHTLGHAIEALDGYDGRSHGEAVAIGMMFAARVAAAHGFSDRVDEHRVALESFDLPTHGAGHAYADIARAWSGDKKYEAGMRFVLLEDLGKPVVVRDIDEAVLRDAYEAVR